MKIYLKPGRDASVRRRHPWIFSGAVARTEGDAALGAVVELYSAAGELLGRGAWSPHSQIRVRLWTFDERPVDADLIGERLRNAVELRKTLFPAEITALRLVNSESDGLPGVIVDRYGDYAVCQFLSAGAEFWRETIVAALAESGAFKGIYERSDAKVRQQEGLKMRAGLLSGEEPPPLVEVREGAVSQYVDLRRGHKTGLYLDQRENRAAVSRFSRGARVLNAFSYSGGFALHAFAGGAESAVNIDTSQNALDLCVKNAELNGFDTGRMTNIHGDVFNLLRRMRDHNQKFDLVVLDPPKFAESGAQVQGAARGYKDINMLAMQVLQPGGILFTFSCSGHVSPPLFQKIVADAAVDAGREAVILGQLSQAADHPVPLAFPEAAYLKGLICRVC